MATSRTRTRTQPKPSGIHTITYHGMTGTPINESIPWVQFPHSQTTIDTVTKNFRKLVQEGAVMNNPFTSSQSWFHVAGEYVGEGWGGLTNGVPDPAKGYARHVWTNGVLVQNLAYAPVPAIDNSQSIQQARIRALAAINKSDVMAYVSVGEWHKTKLLHKQVGTALLETVKGFYRRNPTKATLKAFSNGWLTYRYALMPTLYELEGAVKLFNRKISENQRYTARSYGDVQKETTSYTHYFADSHGWMYTFFLECTREVTYRAGVLYESTAFGKMIGGLGLTRPLSSVYELTKFSWMLDWWVDIGTWLDAMEPNGSSKTLAAWNTVRDRTTHTLQMVGMVQQTSVPLSERIKSKSRSFTGVSRTLITDVKSRDPWDATLPWLPAKGSGLNLFRSLDVVSLVTQKLGFKSGSYIRGVRF